MHTPEFIEEMKQKLLQEQGKLQKELKNIAHSDHGDYQANYPEYGRHPDENAGEMADHEARATTTEAVEARLKEVDAALARINDNKYGISANGSLVSKERLRANPAATGDIAKE